jgi:hypothetical protein
MNILQKEDLAAASFANTNANAAGGVAIRTDAGSTVGTAITAATPAAQTLSIAGQTLSLSGGGGSVAVPSTTFATPAETIAGTATGKALDPADLTAKLANQPAAGACTDREDVVWNGAILQGAAKHYSIPRTVLRLTTPPTILDGTFTDSVDISITNPSNCRTLRLTFDDVSGYLYTPSMTPGLGNFMFGVFTTFGTGMQAFASTVTDASGKFFSVANKGFFATAGYIDVPPGATTAVQFSVNNQAIIPQTLSAGGVEFYFNAAFTGQTV